MTGFDETVPPDSTSADEDATSAENATDNVVKPVGGPEQTDADDEDAPKPFGGDDDIAAGHPEQ